MKKKVILILIIIISLFFIVFSVNYENIKKNINEENQNIIKNEYIPALALLYEGKMDDIEFGIGINYDKLIAQWGDPEEYTESFMGGKLLKYGDTYFLVSDDIITGIYYTGDDEIYGIKIGMGLEQIVEILGGKNRLYRSIYSELYINDPLILEYKAGKYIVNFEINTENKKVDSISIFQDLSK